MSTAVATKPAAASTPARVSSPPEERLLALLAAWLDTCEDDERLSSEKVADGEWITQVEAQRLAAGNGYELEVDD